MNKAPLVCLAALLLSACGSAKYLADQSGDGSEVISFAPLVSRQEFVSSREKEFKSKLSPNYYDYPIQYYLQFLNGLALEGTPLNPGNPSIMARGRDVSGAMATSDFLSSTLLGSPSRFGTGFNAAMIGLSLIAPRSPEETFAGWAKFYHAEFVSPSITFYRVDSVPETASDQEVDQIFAARFLEMRTAVRLGNLGCDSERESLHTGLDRESSVLRSTCLIDGKAVKFARKSWLAMPGSLAREYLGPSVVSRVTFRDVGTRRFDSLLTAHAKLLQNGWVAIYPEFTNGVATKIVVAQAGTLKRFDPPQNPFPEAKK